MDKYYDNFINFKGFAPYCSRRVPAQIVESYQGKLPNQLLSYWQEYGWCGYADGLFWTENPADWDGHLGMWLTGTEYENRDVFHVIARNAFGKLYLWGENTGPSLQINIPVVQMYSFNSEDYLLDGPDLSVQFFFSTSDKSFVDFYDDNGDACFERAVSKLGKLQHDTVYGFVPALPLGGTAVVDNLQVLNLYVYSDLLSQLC